ncbi:MAG: hypothetical protein S4CHLAM123_05930 [Chlamydiales bacterium]|nr:hypothetical protein [Chlamydiales bacterium]
MKQLRLPERLHKRSLPFCRTSLEIKQSFYLVYPTRHQADPAHPVNLTFGLINILTSKSYNSKLGLIPKQSIYFGSVA